MIPSPKELPVQLKDKCKQISTIQCLGHTTDKYSIRRGEEAEGQAVDSGAGRAFAEMMMMGMRELNL